MISSINILKYNYLKIILILLFLINNYFLILLVIYNYTNKKKKKKIIIIIIKINSIFIFHLFSLYYFIKITDKLYIIKNFQ